VGWQGVSFRPCLIRLAASLGLQESVANVAAGVRLELLGERLALQTFLERPPRELPAASCLEGLEVDWRPPRTPASCGLQIAAKEPSPLGPVLIAS
jgi:hydrogenase maturation protein HypF